VSAVGAFRLVIIDCIDMPFAYEMARSLGMLAVENLLRDMTVELQARLPWRANFTPWRSDDLPFSPYPWRCHWKISH
jgi:hypothetical protein